MGNLLYTIAIILVILWAIGFIGYSMGGLIHILLAIALVAVILRLFKADDLFKIAISEYTYEVRKLAYFYTKP